jgi:hypothetical protein
MLFGELAIAALIDTYYIDEGAAETAARTRGAFNVIQLSTMTKIDIYCSPDEPLARDELRRRVFVDVDGERIPFASAEDIILQKLKWFVAGGGVSDRQWRDIRGVIRVQGAALDRAYLEHHAASHRVLDLLQRALNE